MKKHIAVVGAGALGGYVGGSLAHHGHDVTLIDPWPANVEAIRSRGLELDGITPEEKFTARPRALHLSEVQSLMKTPVDVAFVAVKSYDTLWATALIAPYLSPQGFVVSLQNCMNEETIAGVVGWGRTIGAVASQIAVDLYEPGKIRRTVPKGGERYTIFRIGEPHGRVTPRVEELVSWLSRIDSAKGTTNLWGERWSKLVQNSMGNPVTAATGLSVGECLRDERLRRFQIMLAGESIAVGRALGYELEKVRGAEPELYEKAAKGDAQAMQQLEALVVPKQGANPRGDLQRPSMAQDVLKGRRTEIDAMNGLVARKAKEIGMTAPSHEKITGIIKKIERGELQPSVRVLE